MKSEFERFQIMFNDLFWFTDRCLDHVPPEILDWIPELGDRVHYGDRVLLASIRNLYIHIIYQRVRLGPQSQGLRGRHPDPPGWRS